MSHLLSPCHCKSASDKPLRLEIPNSDAMTANTAQIENPSKANHYSNQAFQTILDISPINQLLNPAIAFLKPVLSK